MIECRGRLQRENADSSATADAIRLQLEASKVQINNLQAEVADSRETIQRLKANFAEAIDRAASFQLEVAASKSAAPTRM